MKEKEFQIETAAEEAEMAFWKKVSEHFPGISTGDFPPEQTLKFQIACNDAIRVWLQWNEVRVAPVERGACGSSGTRCKMDRDYVYEGMEAEAARELEEQERIEAEQAREDLEDQASEDRITQGATALARAMADRLSNISQPQPPSRASKIKEQAEALLASMRDSDMQIGTIALCKLVIDLAEELDR